jgi:hypothetical protein
LGSVDHVDIDPLHPIFGGTYRETKQLMFGNDVALIFLPLCINPNPQVIPM